MKSPWLWAAILGAGYLIYTRTNWLGIGVDAPAPRYGDLPPPPDVTRYDEYGMPMTGPGEPIADEGVQLAEHIWGYSKVPTLDQFRRMDLGRGY